MLNDFSGTIQTANVSQVVAAADASATDWDIENLSKNADLWVGIGQAAVKGPGSYRVPPGKLLSCSGVPAKAQAALYILSDTAGAGFTCKRSS